MDHITRRWDLNLKMGSLRISSLREIFSDRGANNHSPLIKRYFRRSIGANDYSPVLKEKGNILLYIM